VPAAPLSDREQAAWRGFLRTHARLWRELEAHLETEHGISLAAYDVLVLLDEAPGNRLRMSELADAVLMSSGGFTRLADRLCAEGLASRKRSAADGRGYELVLTEKGRERLELARQTHRSDIRARFLSLINKKEQQALGELWQRLADQATGSE